MKLGSLFDGSGGFPLAGTIHGIEPVWASEIEPYPLRVTAARFPRMKQLGDVTKINGAEIEPVDVITFGSPCQDLSVAGRQLGIHEGERSNLFFEAIRIIKEMRGATHGEYPRFAVWENVPGAFSSNKGADFRAVLQAFCEVGGEAVPVPEPPKGKWGGAGCIVGTGYSVAWRTYDAQYWGVPQRRKRIYLVADFASERAGEILFEREGMRWDPAPSREAWEGTAEDAEGCAGRSYHRISNLISVATQQGGAEILQNDLCPTITAAAGMSGNNQPWICGAFMGGQGAKAGSIAYDEAVSPTLRATASGSNQTPDVVYSIQGNVVDRDAKQNGAGVSEGTAHTVNTQDRHAVAFDCRNMRGNTEISGTIQANGRDLSSVNPVVYDQQRFGQYGNSGIGSSLKARDYKDATDLIVEKQEHRYIVRRLTPLECCRLQGFPDWWEDGAEGSDSARYKMWGNGIALPCAVDVLGRIATEVLLGE